MNLKETTEKLWNLYFAGKDDDLLELQNCFTSDCVVIGTGKHEIYHSSHDFFCAMDKEVQERNEIMFHFKDFWCEQKELSPDSVLVYGGLFIWWESEDRSISINMDSRYTMIYRRFKKEWKIVHVHQSLPNLEQQDGEYYPKTLSEQVRKGQEQIETLSELATKDSLTGLINFRTFQDIFKENNRINTWLFEVDLDRFKEINDTYGHVEGNNILKEFSALIQASVRNHDHVCRMGGDEFILLCNDLSSTKDAEVVMKRIQTAVKKAAKDKTAWITVSIGGTRVGAEDSLESALKRADKALYEVKFTGKNNWKLKAE